MPSLLQLLGQFSNVFQCRLFPAIEEAVGPLSATHEKFAKTLAMLELDGFVTVQHGRGRPAHDRGAIARAFVAKAIWNLHSTRATLDRLQCDAAMRRLCGWESVAAVPDETIFSRAFAEFAKNEFGQRVHAALIEKTQKQRLVGHISRDTTAIEGREKATPKPKPEPTVAVLPGKCKRRRRRKAGELKPLEQMKRTERQASGRMTLAEMIGELPRACDVGCKTNSAGHKSSWVGYKLHLDVADGQIPVTCLLTSASLHDSQAAIPMAEMTAQLVTSLYDLMDKGYESTHIEQHSEKLGHVPIIDRQKRSADSVGMAPHQQERFRERTAVERVFARLKEEFGGQSVRVRGAAKVMAHLMFGILALTVDQLLRLSPPS
jgi:IS5 family transposase